MKSYLILIFLFIITYQTNAQTWSIHLNGNETYFLGNEQKGQHPILWYSSDDDRGFLVGGFGVGISHSRPWMDNKFLKFQFNAQRSRFYDLPTIYLDGNGNPLGGFIGVNTNWNANLNGLAIFPITENNRWLFGIGLGVRGTFTAKSDYGEAVVNGQVTDLKLPNKSFSPVTLLLPLEITKFFNERLSVTSRLELAMTKTTRLSAYSKERTLVYFVEFGYQLK